MGTTDLHRFTQIRESSESLDSRSQASFGRHHDPETYAIIGAAMEVHRELKNGFLEVVYQEALSAELKLRKIPFEREVLLSVLYKQQKLPCFYKADFLCFGSILVEIKVSTVTTPVDEAQLINYLKITGLRRGILLNFGTSSLMYKRLIYDQPLNLCQSV